VCSYTHNIFVKSTYQYHQVNIKQQGYTIACNSSLMADIWHVKLRVVVVQV